MGTLIMTGRESQHFLWYNRMDTRNILSGPTSYVSCLWKVGESWAVLSCNQTRNYKLNGF